MKLVKLPNSEIEVEISSLYWQKSDPRDMRQAIYPDINAPQNWKTFIEGQDPALRIIANLDPDDPILNRSQSSVFNWFRNSLRGN